MSLFTGLAAAPQPKGAARIQRACASCGGKSKTSEGAHEQGTCDTCRKKRLQRDGSGAGAPSPTANASMPALPSASGGQRLPGGVRSQLEPLFGTSFADVRVHDDGASHASARQLNANAYTLGQHVYFAAGRFRPDERSGLHLLAHELSHTVQQRGAGVSSASLALDAVDVDAPDAPLEREADATADAVLAGRAVRVMPGTASSATFSTQARLQRDAADLSETQRHAHDATSGVDITRTVHEPPCTSTPVTRATPSNQIFRFDSESHTIGLHYTSCRGSIRLTAETSISYDRVLEAGRQVLNTLQTNPAAGNDIGTLLRGGLNDARLDMQGNVTLTVDGVLQARVSSDSSVSTGNQRIAVRGELRVTPGGVSFRLTGGAELERTPELLRENYTLALRIGTRWFAVNLGYDATRETPGGAGTSGTGAGTSTDTLHIGAELPLPDFLGLSDMHLGPTLDVDLRSGEPSLGGGGLVLRGRFGGEDSTPSVRCFECNCPAPEVRYHCTPYGTERVVDRQAEDRQERLLYRYDSDQPADSAAYQQQVNGVAQSVSQGWEVRAIRGHASPEGRCDYNLRLSQQRADAAAAALSRAVSAAGATASLPAARGEGELLGGCNDGGPTTETGSTANRDLIADLGNQLRGLNEEGRLDLLDVPRAERDNPTQRAAALADIQAFIDGRDARGRRLGQRARWERIFPRLRRVEVELHRPEAAHDAAVAGAGTQSDCDAGERAWADAHMAPLPPERRMPSQRCGESGSS